MIMPLGYQFRPTEEELISGYLLSRVMGLPLPCPVILEKDLYGPNTAPCDVFGDIDEYNSYYWHSEDNGTKGIIKKTIYVFTKLVKADSTSRRITRRAGSGTWSGQTGAREIKNFNGEIIGSSKMFTFKDSDANKDGYHWIMHEYSLDGAYKSFEPDTNNDVVLCKITRSFKGNPGTNTENNVGSDQIPQPMASTIQNNGDGYSFPRACSNGGSVDHQITQSAAAIENNEDGYCFSSARTEGGFDDQIPQQTAIENNEAPLLSLSGQKRSSDEGVLQLDCEGQINPKKPRNYEDNYDDLFDEQPLADLGTFNTDDNLFEGLEDMENWRW